LAGLVALVLVAAATIYAISEARFRKTYAIAPESVTIATDSATLARGEHLVSVIGKCIDCHGEHFEGRAMIDEPPMGRLVALNLTPGEGGIGNALTPADIERAVRHGVGRNGRALRIMPSDDYQYLSDEDIAAVASYVKHLAPANNVLAPSHLLFLPRLLIVVAGMPALPAEAVSRSNVRPMSPTPGPTAQYGEYLALIGGCKGCHGPNLSGGKVLAGNPSWPPAANLTSSGHLGQWTEQQFVQTLRAGKRPDGSSLNDAMPWRLTGRMTDDEMHAVWLYLKSVPRRAFGNH